MSPDKQNKTKYISKKGNENPDDSDETFQEALGLVKKKITNKPTVHNTDDNNNIDETFCKTILSYFKMTLFYERRKSEKIYEEFFFKRVFANSTSVKNNFIYFLINGFLLNA